MAIYLTENFHLNSNQPFDVRMVVGSQSYYLDKDDIVSSGYIYPGLRVWDFNTGTIGTPYVWTGTEWSSENDIGALVPSPSGNQNYIVKFVDDTTSLSRSSMYDDGNSIGIGLEAASIQPDSLNGLHVLGNIKTNSLFIGNGSLISQIDAGSITSGILSLNRIERTPFIPGTTYVLTQLNTSVSWLELNTNPIITIEDLSSAEHYINFTSTANGSSDNINAATNLKYIPSTQQILGGLGTALKPSYSFIGNTDKGMYWDNAGIISFKTGGNGKVGVFDGGLLISHDQFPQISFYSTTTTKARLLLVNNSNNLLFRFDSTVLVDDKQVWHDSNLYHLRQAPITGLETGRNSNGITVNGSGQSIGGIYSYNLLDDSTMNSSLSSVYTSLDINKKHWSTLVVGNGSNGGSFQVAGNWKGASASNREMLVRGLDSSVTSWSEWSRVCLNESQSFKWSMGKTHSTRDMLKIWMENNNPKFIITSFFDTGGNTVNTNSGNGFNIPFNPTIPSTTTVVPYDRYGTRNIIAQARHNIRGYDIYYGVVNNAQENGVYLCMFKNASFNSATMREWSLLDAVSSNIIWTPADLNNGGGGHYSSPIIAPVTSLNATINTFMNNKLTQAYPNGSATYGGFSAIRIHHDEDGNSVFQNTQVAIHLQPRFIQEAPI